MYTNHVKRVTNDDDFAGMKDLFGIFVVLGTCRDLNLFRTHHVPTNNSSVLEFLWERGSDVGILQTVTGFASSS